jgi:hypothetical protein
MHLSSPSALWLLRRLTGYRLKHLLALALLPAVLLAGVAIPFWWLGEQADAAAGIAGVLLVAVAYLSVSTLVLAFSTLLLGRLVLARVRRRAAHLGFGASRARSGVRISF